MGGASGDGKRASVGDLVLDTWDELLNEGDMVESIVGITGRDTTIGGMDMTTHLEPRELQGIGTHGMLGMQGLKVLVTKRDGIQP